jgi:chromosome segregation ATPase
MQGRIDSLERQLEEATDRDRENRRTIAALTSSLEEANRENRRVILTLTSRFPAIEAPPGGHRCP